MKQRVNKTVIDLDAMELDLLAWLAEWTPDVHRANWQVCRAWPPGFRYIEDLSVAYRNEAKVIEAKERQTISPRRDDILKVERLLGYRLVEGCHRILRLTPRGNNR